MTRTVSNRFSEILGAKRINISDVSRKTGISRTTLTNLYYGKGTAISFTVLSRLCDFLNCGIEDILFIEGE